MATVENIPQSTPRPIPQPECPLHPTHVETDDDGFTPVVTKAMKKRMRKSPSVPVPVANAQKLNANMRTAPGIIIREGPKDTIYNNEKSPTFHVGKGKGVMEESIDSSSVEMRPHVAQRRFPHIGCSRDMEAFGANSYDREFPPLQMSNPQKPKGPIKKEFLSRTPSRVVPAPVQQVQVNDPSRETSEQRSTNPSAVRLGRPRVRAHQNDAPRSWHYQFYSGKPTSYESKYDSTISSRSRVSKSNEDHWEERQSPRYHSAEPTDHETGRRYFFGHHMQRVMPQRNERQDTPLCKSYESTHHQHRYYQQPTHHYEPALTPGGRRVLTRRLTAREYRLLLQDRAGDDLSPEDRRRVRWLREHLCDITTVPDLNNPPPSHVMNVMPVSVTDDDDMYFKRRRTIVPNHRPVTRSQSRSRSVSLEVENNDNESSASSYSYSHSNDTSGSVEKEYESNSLGAEQVLTTDEMSLDDKLVQLQRDLQQKEEEIAQLRAQTFSNPTAQTNTSDVQHHSTAVSLDTVQRLITEGVRAQLMQNQYAMRPGYTKPYPAEIDMIPFPANYRQPQFAKFNGNGSPHEHIAHFLAACQDTAHNGALLLRQFVQTLSGPAFTWYSKLLPGSIRNWEQMQEAFLQRFYNTQRTVGITELTRTEQTHNERASDFINRWRNLSLHCPQPITEPEAVRMCMNNLRPEMAVHLQGVRPMTFEELASKSTDIENYLNQLNRRSDKGNHKFFEHGLDKGKKDLSRDRSKHVMETSVATQYTKIRPNEANVQSKNSRFNGVGKPRSLKDRLEKEYSFPKEVVEDFFKGLTEMKLIQLPEPRQVNENTKRHDDGRYCKYHRMPGHTLEECFVFKDKVQEMIDDGTIDPALLKNFKKGRQSANMVSINQVDEEVLPGCMDTLTLSSYAVPYIPPSYRPMEDSSSPETLSKVPHHVIHMKELMSPSTPPTVMKRKIRTPTPFPIITCSVRQSPPSHLKKRLFAEDTKSSRVMPVLIPRQGSTLPEIPLPTTDDEDSMSEPEQLYTNQGKPYVSKKQKKRHAFKERIKATRNNPISTEASQLPRPKKKRSPKYKILRKVMPKEEIEGFIARVSRELYINKPQVVDNNTPWTDDLHCNIVGVVEGDDEPLCFPEETSEANITTRSGIQTKEIRPPPVEYIIPRKEKAQPHDNVTPNVAGPSETVKYNVLAHLKKIPSLLSVYDALCLSSDLRKAFVTAMQFPDDYRVEVANVDINPLEVLNIEFTDEDLLLGSKLHNRPLLVTGDLEDTPINRIMLDCGSAVNLIPLRTLTRLGYTIRNLTRSNIVIQGFNQTGQQALGTMRLTLRFQGWISTPLFHVIDAFTSYNALLGRPWLHEYGVISSSLHQCFKYKTPEGEIRRVFADKQPFTTTEAFYADAKFYFEGIVAKEIKGTDFRANKVNPKKGTTHNGENPKKVIYRYIPREQRKDGDPVFQILEDEVLNSNQGKEFSCQKEKMKSLQSVVFVPASSVNDEESTSCLPILCYDQKTLNMMKKMGYDVKLTSDLINGGSSLAPFDKMLSQEQRDALYHGKRLSSTKKGLGYEVYMTSSQELMDLQPAPSQLEEGGQATTDELEEINLGTNDNPRPIFISAHMCKEEKDEYKRFLFENKDVFAWSYKEMPGLDPNVAVHRLAISSDITPIKQQQRRFRPEILPQIIAEIDKLLAADFIREVKYPIWLANIVPVKKKNGQTRVCIDFRDLNKACPKDDFPLPISELLIDSTTGHEVLSFMDGYSGYNQIRMAPEDEEFTAFRTPKGIFCYKVMPFGLKNAGATYQRAMTEIFTDLLHDKVECYVDDIVIKTKRRNEHLQDLSLVFERLRKHQLKMNPTKCAFGVSSGKFLGFVVRKDGIEIDPAKTKAIIEMSPPRNLHELKSLQGRLAYIRRFIANLAGRCQPFTRLMKKGVSFEWDEACQNAFESVKKYLTCPPVLGVPIKGRPLILYTAALPMSLGALLAQVNDEGKEVALYYLSRMMLGAEQNYPGMEKICLALVFAAQKLRHYMLEHTIHLVSRADPLRYILGKLVLSGRLAKWAMFLTQFDIVYVPQKAVKGQALADFLADHALPGEREIEDDLPDDEVMTTFIAPSWVMYFDGASRGTGAGAGVIFVTPKGESLPYSFTLTSASSNNEAEYEALIIGLELALDLHLDPLIVYGDSQLVIHQLNGKYAVKKKELIPYFLKAQELLHQFQEIQIEHVPRSYNHRADALASLAASLAISPNTTLQINVEERRVLSSILEESPQEILTSTTISAYIEEETDWRRPLLDYLNHGILPADSHQRQQIKKRAIHYTCIEGILFRRSFDGMLLRCLSESEAMKALEEVHAGVCGAHQSGRRLYHQLKHLGYYWPAMVQDAMQFAKRCHVCQIHADFIHQPPEPLHTTNVSWPFDAWGMDIVGPIHPPSSKGHSYILAATDYFSKWAEAIPLKDVRGVDVVNFVRTHLIYRFGIPARIVSDNGTPFKNQDMQRLCAKFHIKHYFSSAYNAAANGQAEAFNKTLCKLLKKVVSHNKREWHERLMESLWAYRTTIRTPTGSTPYALVFGGEAVLPLEVQIPSYRVAIHEGLSEDEALKARLEELDGLEHKRLKAKQILEMYQARISRAFDKKVHHRSFNVGDLVLAVVRPMIITRRTKSKFDPKWEGPFIVQEVYSNGAYKIISPDGEYSPPPINAKFLKRYYA